MANKKIWLGMLIMVLAFGLAFVGCKTEAEEASGGAIASELVGTWGLKSAPESFTLEITSSKITFGGSAGTAAGSSWDALVDAGYTWRAGDGKIEIGSSGVFQTVYEYTISGEELTLKSSGIEVGVFVKQ